MINIRLTISFDSNRVDDQLVEGLDLRILVEDAADLRFARVAKDVVDLGNSFVDDNGALRLHQQLEGA